MKNKHISPINLLFGIRTVCAMSFGCQVYDRCGCDGCDGGETTGMDQCKGYDECWDHDSSSCGCFLVEGDDMCYTCDYGEDNCFISDERTCGEFDGICVIETCNPGIDLCNPMPGGTSDAI